jgi:hypothetical protein
MNILIRININASNSSNTPQTVRPAKNTLAKTVHMTFQTESLLATIEKINDPSKHIPAKLNSTTCTVFNSKSDPAHQPSTNSIGATNSSDISHLFMVKTILPRLD